MAYIPTIHTFEDDVNENRGFEESPIVGGLDKMTDASDILVPAEREKSLSKKILALVSAIFILGSLSLVGYYLYQNYQNKKSEEAALVEALAKSEEDKVSQNIKNDLTNIFNRTGEEMSSYVSSTIQKNNIIILTIKNDNLTDNYSKLYSYILAHKKTLGVDLVEAFKLEEASDAYYEDTLQDATSTNTTSTSTKSTNTSATTSTSSNVFGNIFNGKSVEENFEDMMAKISKPSPISGNDLLWQSKTLNNQDFEIANAGVVTLIYGYVGKNYVVFTTSLKDFFDTVNSLK
ncbi:MAG: hypothetical protein RI945_192 [Candidatus Parcubacteria bacterium]|jgi:hypothetical protein